MLKMNTRNFINLNFLIYIGEPQSIIKNDKC